MTVTSPNKNEWGLLIQ